MAQEKIGLIFEGGGMRGLYTCGAADAFLEKGFLPDMVYGVSAGACHAISYLSNQKGRSRHVNIDYCTRKDYAGLYCMLHEHSIFGWKLIFDTLPRENPIDYEAFFNRCNSAATSRRLVMVATDANTARAVYFTPETVEQVIMCSKASSSLPFVSPAAIIDGVPYFDGGIADSIPVQRALDDGCTKLVVVCTQPAGYRKKPQKCPALVKLIYRAYPALAEAIIARPDAYNAQLELVAKLEAEGRAVVIRPDASVSVGRMERNPAKLEPLYQAGLQDGYRVCRMLEDEHLL